MEDSREINWDNLKNIPFSLCQVTEDSETTRIYYMGHLVLHDYNHVGHYLSTAIVLFQHIRNRNADWVNLANLWTLRDCIRENYNHWLGVDFLIYGNEFDGDNSNTLTPLTQERFKRIVKAIKDKDPYATIWQAK